MADKAGLQAAIKAAFVAQPGLVADSDAVDPLMAALANALWPYLSMVANSGVYLTPEGGVAVPFINKTGAASVKGTLVQVSATTDFAFEVNPAGGDQPFGVVYDSGIADGESCHVVVAGEADVLIEAGDTIARQAWAASGLSTAGRVTLAAAAPASPGFTQVGHCQETKANGGNTLARLVLHFG